MNRVEACQLFLELDDLILLLHQLLDQAREVLRRKDISGSANNEAFLMHLGVA